MPMCRPTLLLCFLHIMPKPAYKFIPLHYIPFAPFSISVECLSPTATNICARLLLPMSALQGFADTWLSLFHPSHKPTGMPRKTLSLCEYCIHTSCLCIHPSHWRSQLHSFHCITVITLLWRANYRTKQSF